MGRFIKICCIASPEEAWMAIRAGADAILTYAALEAAERLKTG